MLYVRVAASSASSPSGPLLALLGADGMGESSGSNGGAGDGGFLFAASHQSVADESTRDVTEGLDASLLALLGGGL